MDELRDETKSIIDWRSQIQNGLGAFWMNRRFSRAWSSAMLSKCTRPVFGTKETQWKYSSQSSSVSFYSTSCSTRHRRGCCTDRGTARFRSTRVGCGFLATTRNTVRHFCCQRWRQTLKWWTSERDLILQRIFVLVCQKRWVSYWSEVHCQLCLALIHAA